MLVTEFMEVTLFSPPPSPPPHCSKHIPALESFGELLIYTQNQLKYTYTPCCLTLVPKGGARSPNEEKVETPPPRLTFHLEFEGTE
jgi:hypothetical protein